MEELCVEIVCLLNFSQVRPMRTVYSFKNFLLSIILEI